MLISQPGEGFSLVELVIGLAILSLLLVIGLPSFTTYIQNTKLRTAAEAFLAGVQSARGEAVRRNAQVQIILTNDDADVTNRNTTALSTTGQNWIVRALDPTTGLYDFIEAKAMAEGSGQAAASSVQIDGGASSSVTFNGFGTTTLGAAATFAFSNPGGGACAPTGPMRCMNIVVSVGGQARMCDPAVTAAGDTRRC